MSSLNKDVLFLIFKELQNDSKFLYSCLLFNRTWCERAVLILLKNPVNVKSTLFDVILLHLSEESRDILKNIGIDNIITETYRRPLFNYIKFWRYLNLSFIEKIISSKNNEKSNMSIIRNEILKLFINGNAKFIHLSFPEFFYHKYHITGTECCFTELESFYCRADINQNILEGLAKTCKSIKELRFYHTNFYTTNFGIIKLIEVQKNLNDISFYYNSGNKRNKPYKKSLEEPLIKYANTIQYLRIGWEPITNIFSYLINLLSLEINLNAYPEEFNNLENLSLPILKFLKTLRVSHKVLANLIESTKGHLSEISISYTNDVNYSSNDEKLIQTIYQKCPNLKYLKIPFVANFDTLISSEFENLLVNCQFLNGLIISNYDNFNMVFSWGKLFEILTESSSINLSKFKFYSFKIIKLESLELFFDNWKNRNPMSLIISSTYMNAEYKKKLEILTKKYKAKGVIKKYFIGYSDNFEWA